MAQPLLNEAIDLAIGTDNDLVVDADLQFVSGIAAVAQMCRIAVQMFAGEWFLDLDVGIPYWDEILGNNPTEASLLAREAFAKELRAVNGVLDILSLNVTFDNAASRTLTVSWQVQTALGNTPTDLLLLSPTV